MYTLFNQKYWTKQYNDINICFIEVTVEYVVEYLSGREQEQERKLLLRTLKVLKSTEKDWVVIFPFEEI